MIIFLVKGGQMSNIRVSWEQQVLADLMEKGLDYSPKGKSDRVTENHAFWFHNLAEDQLFKGLQGYQCDAIGMALIGKFGSPDDVWAAIKESHMAHVPELFVRLKLFVSAELTKAVMDLHDEKTNIREVIKILRTRDLYDL